MAQSQLFDDDGTRTQADVDAEASRTDPLTGLRIDAKPIRYGRSRVARDAAELFAELARLEPRRISRSRGRAFVRLGTWAILFTGRPDAAYWIAFEAALEIGAGGPAPLPKSLAAGIACIEAMRADRAPDVTYGFCVGVPPWEERSSPQDAPKGGPRCTVDADPDLDADPEP